MKILIAGDFAPRYRVAAQIEKGDYSCLGEVKPFIQQVDYSIVNLESPVVTREAKPIEKIGPNLCCTEKAVECLAQTGFNCVTLANNHFYDYGDEGVADTLNACERYGIEYIGGGRNITEASQTFYKNIGDHTLAIINCCEHEYNIATDTFGGSNPLNSIQQYYAIQKARKYADYVLVIVHGGHEHWQLPSPRMVETYRFFIDAGADVVVNHHQHCFSGYEVYNGKLIFYGLGNFCFDIDPIKTDDPWNLGYLTQIEFTDHAIPSFKIYPYKQCDDAVGVHLLDIDVFDETLTCLNLVISDNIKLIEKTNQYYKQSAKKIKFVFEPIQNRIIAGLQHRCVLPSLVSQRWLLKMKNYIVCESHRDKVYYFLNHQL